MVWTNLGKIIQLLMVILIIVIIYYIINIGNKYVEERKKIKIDNTKTFKTLGFLIFVFLFFFIIKKYSFLSESIYAIFMAIIFSYLLNPIVNYFEKKGLSRFLSVVLIYLILAVIIFLLIFVFGPNIMKEFKNLGSILPRYLDRVFGYFDSIYDKYIKNIDNIPPQLDGVKGIFKDNVSEIEKIVTKWIKKFTDKTIDIFSKIFTIVLIPILSFYFLNDKEYFKKKIYFCIPKDYRNHVLKLSKDVNKVISQFIKGRVLVAMFVGITTTISLFFLRIDFALIIGLMAGIADIIPYFGPVIGIIPAVFFALLKSPIRALWVIIIFTIIQQIESNIITPKIVGESVGIHPVTVILSLIIGGGFFGVTGMILAIPVVGILKVLYSYLIENINRG
ncbi:AI-2E family transporter [Anaerosalibacter sp. Marseille-P3206]|uniref:AI-2E family transporter n=1 Tax=Anaerosalibacter sp. Marseille-P3206 TaxID=1871005 RepID=UPI000987BEC0|nr:AI-2E family transporter [Anaerosalibacter sp. Marseille-P3206]